MPNLEMPDGVRWRGTESGGEVGIWTLSSKDGVALRNQVYRSVDEQLMMGGWEECRGADPEYSWARDGQAFRLNFVGGSGYTIYARLSFVASWPSGCSQ